MHVTAKRVVEEFVPFIMPKYFLSWHYLTSVLGDLEFSRNKKKYIYALLKTVFILSKEHLKSTKFYAKKSLVLLWGIIIHFLFALKKTSLSDMAYCLEKNNIRLQ